MSLEIARRWNGTEWENSVEEEGGGAQGEVLVATVDLSSAQILALAISPVEIISAPGAGKMVFPFSGLAYMNFGTQAYTSQPLRVHPDGDPGAYFIQWNSALASTQDVVYTEGTQNVQNNEAPATFEDVAFVVSVPVAVTGGDGSCRVSVVYAVLDLT